MNQTLERTRRIPRGALAALSLLAVVSLTLACSSSTAPLTTLWEATLNSVGASRISGGAAAVTQFGRTEVSVQIRLADPEAEYAWRLESGTCTMPGVIQGGAAQYLPIQTDDAGTGVGQAQLSEQFRPGDKFTVKVYSAGGQTMVACGVFDQV